jgi:anti-sigma factor RsiW
MRREMRANDQDPAGLSNRTVWRRSAATEATDDAAARFLDLAAFADGTLDPDDCERVADWLARDPAAGADVAAARAHAAATKHFPPPPEAVVARACALVATKRQPDNIVAFPAWRRDGRRLRGMAQWSSLAAAVAVAAWLGFTLGINTSRAFVTSQPPGTASFLGDLLDAQTSPVLPFGGGSQT